jgi:hypothetical protein
MIATWLKREQRSRSDIPGWSISWFTQSMICISMTGKVTNILRKLASMDRGVYNTSTCTRTEPYTCSNGCRVPLEAVLTPTAEIADHAQNEIRCSDWPHLEGLVMSTLSLTFYPATTAMTHRNSTNGQISQSLADAAKGVSQLASCGSQARKNLQDALVDLSALQRGVEPEIDTALYKRCQEVYEVHRL